MAEIAPWMIIVIYILLGLLLWKLTKTVVKAILILSALTVILLGFVTYAIISDANEFREGASKGIVVLYTNDNSQVTAGFETTNNKATVWQTSDHIDASNKIRNGQFQELLGNRYKIFIVTPQAVEDIEDVSLASAVPGVPDLTDSEVRNVLTNGVQTLSQNHPELSLFPQEELELYVISQVFSLHIIGEPLFMLRSYKQDTIVVYPESALFSLFRFVPSFILSSTTLELFQSDENPDIVEVKTLS